MVLDLTACPAFDKEISRRTVQIQMLRVNTNTITIKTSSLELLSCVFFFRFARFALDGWRLASIYNRWQMSYKLFRHLFPWLNNDDAIDLYNMYGENTVSEGFDYQKDSIDGLQVIICSVLCSKTDSVRKANLIFDLFDTQDLQVLFSEQLRALLVASLTSFCVISDVDVPSPKNIADMVDAYVSTTPLAEYRELARHDFISWCWCAPEALIVLSTFHSRDILRVQARLRNMSTIMQHILDDTTHLRGQGNSASTLNFSQPFVWDDESDSGLFPTANLEFHGRSDNSMTDGTSLSRLALTSPRGSSCLPSPRSASRSMSPAISSTRGSHHYNANSTSSTKLPSPKSTRIMNSSRGSYAASLHSPVSSASPRNKHYGNHPMSPSRPNTSSSSHRRDVRPSLRWSDRKATDQSSPPSVSPSRSSEHPHSHCRSASNGRSSTSLSPHPPSSLPHNDLSKTKSRALSAPGTPPASEQHFTFTATASEQPATSATGVANHPKGTSISNKVESSGPNLSIHDHEPAESMLRISDSIRGRSRRESAILYGNGSTPADEIRVNILYPRKDIELLRRFFAALDRGGQNNGNVSLLALDSGVKRLTASNNKLFPPPIKTTSNTTNNRTVTFRELLSLMYPRADKMELDIMYSWVKLPPVTHKIVQAIRVCFDRYDPHFTGEVSLLRPRSPH